MMGPSRGQIAGCKVAVDLSDCRAECRIVTYNISVIPTPDDAVPLLEPCLADIREALQFGIDYANDLQPDPADRDPWFASHAARFRARRELETADGDGWAIVPGVPNSGIHLLIDGLHVVRVLRSSGGTTPAPGHSRQRRDAWSQHYQMQLALDDNGDLPPLNLILDWSTEHDDLLVLHLGMPRGVWKYGNDPVLSWRVELPGDDNLDSLFFPGTEDGPVDVTLRVDDTEREAM